jgi:hypothetical protein
MCLLHTEANTRQCLLFLVVYHCRRSSQHQRRTVCSNEVIHLLHSLESSDFVFENNVNNEKAFISICSFGWFIIECVKEFIVVTVRDLTVGLY